LNLQNTGGNRSKAAKIMGIQRTYLSRLISKYNIVGI
jgi:DNA-binding protein Fis